MKATFFVNSGLINHPGHLTWQGLRMMQSFGFEIGGDTVDHLRLTSLSPARVRHQICDDRTNLLNQGLAVNAFAYPYGAADAVAEHEVQACGYSSARLASGVRGGGGRHCLGCAYAETLPPHDRFATRIPGGARASTHIARITKAIRYARQRGGGWIQILIHHVCYHCDRYSITAKNLGRLLDWLRAHHSVVVRRVEDVIGPRSPTIRIVPPASTWTGQGRLSIPIAFSAPAGVRRVRYFSDGHLIGVKSFPPWRLRFNSNSLTPGAHGVRALIEDRRGRVAFSPGVTLVH
jgi:peptidoglycan/xylan/chitin deacetylase (PgdA/CDA1 family)